MAAKIRTLLILFALAFAFSLNQFASGAPGADEIKIVKTTVVSKKKPSLVVIELSNGVTCYVVAWRGTWSDAGGKPTAGGMSCLK